MKHTPSVFALDTNLLVYPTARQFLSGVALELGEVIAILPEVYREITDGGHLALAEAHRFNRRMRIRGADLSDEEKNEALKILQAPVRAWIDSVLLNSPPFISIPSDENVKQGTRTIVDTMPTEAFSGTIHRDTPAGDRQIVAEAVYFGIDILGSNNLDTVDHQELNTWAKKRGWNRDLIQTPSQLVLALASDNIATAYQWAMAFGMHKISSRPLQNQQEFSKTLNVLSRAGFQENRLDAFERLVFKLKAHMRNDKSFEPSLKAALEQMKSSRRKVIELEITLNDHVNTALRSFEDLVMK